MRPIPLFLLALAFAPPAWADGSPVAVRTGSHPGFGRVVFNFPDHVTSQITRDGDRVVLQFSEEAEISGTSSLPRNVLSVSGGKGHAELVVSPGAEIHESRAGNRVVIDVLDSQGTRPTTPSSKPAAPPAAAHNQSEAPSASPLAGATPPAAGAAPDMPPSVTVPASTSGISADAQKLPPPASPAPAAVNSPVAAKDASSDIVAIRIATPPAGISAAFSVNFGVPAGAAAFRRGHTAYVVFDVKRPVDLAALREDAVFGSATAQNFGAATVIRVTLPQQLSLALSRQGETWTVAAAAADPSLKPIPARAEDQKLRFDAPSPAEVVTIADADTGGEFLVGTQRQSGQAVTAARSAPQFQVLTTWQGVALEPLGDNLRLSSGQQGFVLSAEPEGLALGTATADSDAEAAANALTRRFDFPLLPAEQLRQRMLAAVDAAAASPPLARGPLRRKASEAMISLGLGPEAAAVLQLATVEDPHEATEPETLGLIAVAALLSGRPAEAQNLSDPRLDGTDEIALWRAVRIAMGQEGSPAAASVFATTLPLVLSYPAELRQRLLPLALETMVAGGEKAAAEKALLKTTNDPSLALARGMLSEANGDNEAALSAYDALTNGSDQLARARAARRAVELRLATGRLDAQGAADALDKLLFAWRGDDRELAARLRLAELRAQAGSWRQALALERESEVMFPDQKPMIRERLKGTFASLLRDDKLDKMPPLEFVAMVDENADLLPEGAEGQAMQAQLADHLLALDLPKRARPVLEKLTKQAPSPEARAAFGEHLATLCLREGAAEQALVALKNSDADGLPSELVARRVLTTARAEASRGNLDGAVAALRGIATPEADEARASLLEGAKDWASAETALIDYVAKIVPPEGALNDTQREAVLRLASDAIQAHDEATLISLRQRESKRMEGGALGDQFRLLTAASVRSVNDLPRAASEAGLARHVADALRTPGPRSP